MRLFPSRVLVAAFLSLGLGLLFVGHDPAAGEAKKDEPKSAVALPPVFGKEQPDSIDDLRAIEKHLDALLPKISPAVVGVRFPGSQGSGVIVTKDGIVLTAGHVSGTPDRDVKIILPNGKELKGKTLGKNGTIDSGMVKIIDPGEYPFVDMGKSADLKKGEWVLAIGHPGGFRPNRTPVVRLGRVLVSIGGVVRTDCALVGGDSGGPLFDMNGKVVGIHSRIGGSMTENMHVPVDTYRQTWHRLVKGESWGGAIGQLVLVQSAGGKMVCEVNGRLTIQDPKDKRQLESYAQTHLLRMTPDSAYTIEMHSPDGKKLDPYLRLESPTGEEITEDDDGAGNLNSRIVYCPPTDDTYRIVATTFDPSQIGPYKLIIRQAPVLTGKVDVLPAVGFAKSMSPLVIERLLFINKAYAGVILFDAKGKPATGKALKFHWDGGDAEFKTNDQGVMRYLLAKGKVRNLNVEVPSGLKAAMVLADGLGNPATLDLNPEFAKETVKSAGGKLVMKQEGKLSDKEATDTVRKGCNARTYNLKMTPGLNYTIDLDSTEFNAYLRLEDPDGKQIAENDDGAGNLNARIVLTPSGEGMYRIVVTTSEPQQHGSFRLNVYEAEPKKAGTSN